MWACGNMHLMYIEIESYSCDDEIYEHGSVKGYKSYIGKTKLPTGIIYGQDHLESIIHRTWLIILIQTNK